MKPQKDNDKHAFPANQKVGRTITSLVIICITLISNPASTQQPFSGQISEQTNHYYSAINNQLKSATKIGLAPHDRPACQLLPAHNQRRINSGLNQPPIIADQLLSSDQQIPAILPNAPTNSSQKILEQLSNFSSVIRKSPVIISKKVDTSERLRQLRSLLDSNGYDAYLVTPNDEHGSEYVTDHDRRLRFISGFSGSNGFALILRDRAVLFTDGRYAIQADKDLDCNWWLVVSDQPLIDIHQWLKANAAKGIKIATDARMMSLQNFDYLDDQIKKLDSEFTLISQDLVDVVWNTMSNGDLVRKQPQDLVFIHPIQFAGNISWQEKVVKVSEAMAKLKARHYIVTQLDDIAWLLNLRGNDIPMSPLFKAHLLISRAASDQAGKVLASQTGSVEQLFAANVQQPLQSPQVLQVATSQSIRLILYIDLKKISQEVREYLHADNGTIIVTSNQVTNNQNSDINGPQSQSQIAISSKIQVELKDYEVFIMDIRDKLASNGGGHQLQGKLLLNAGANVAVHVLARSYGDRLVLVESLINKLKSVKNDDEVQGMRLAHWRDSLAISMLLAQLESDISQKGLINNWTEVSASKELKFYRSLMDHNKGESFDTISAYGSNAAIVHYKPNEDGEQRFIGNESTYLLDSGGQYLDGTTDITRTAHYGEPSEFERETYTRVLMGAIDMMSLIFDESSRAAYRLNDLIARRHLFDIGLDYMHGTGHGIGSYSMVHEAPALIEHYTSVSIQRQTNANKQASGNDNNGQQQQQQQQAQILSEPVHLQPNMFTSVEPGYYKANEFGIRLENIVVTQRVNLPSSVNLSRKQNDNRQESSDKQSSSNNDRQFLRFEPISLVPFEPKLIKLELLSNKQKAWLNSYNLMVRIRMTNQINYYLAKIRKLQTQSTPVSIHGTTLSSKLYQQLSIGNNTSKNDSQLGFYNFLGLDPNKFQEKLEQAHKWIMSKTELIQLDVPPAILSPKSFQANEFTAQEQIGNKQVSEGYKKRSKESASLDGHKLMLAYMSSMPFNDLDAAEVVAAFESQIDLAKMSARSGANNTSNQAIQSSKNHCSGYECDLWLLNSLNAHSIQLNNRQQRHRGSSLNSWSEQNGVLINENENQEGSILDLFQLDGNNRNRNVSINMWSLVVLGLVVVVQMSILTYMCTVRSCNGSSRSRSLNNNA